jgi:hypothetical protein
MDNWPNLWFEGLPPFVQRFFVAKLRDSAASGTLDDRSDHLIRFWNHYCQALGNGGGTKY